MNTAPRDHVTRIEVPGHIDHGEPYSKTRSSPTSSSGRASRRLSRVGPTVAPSRLRTGAGENQELGAHLTLDEQRDVVPHPSAAKPGQAPFHRRPESGLGKVVAGAVPEARDDGTHLALAD
jgi:hypothetical protein